MNEVVIKVIGNYSYQTSRCLGEGVYGKVYEGMERQTKQKVAIKKIDLATFTNDKYLENAIFSQIYLLKRFNHPNIVKFKDVLSSKNSLYIITQYCKNGDLKQLIKRKRFRQEEVFEVIRQIINGFSQLIRQKIIHRDLKPANILINEGVYKIGDFGFAKYVDNFGSQMLKSCVGSPIYMAPQILQRAQYSTKCDIWSMGIIFYQMIFGCPPWKARDQSELLRGIRTIPISHIIKRQSLSQKSVDFLKRTLTYSEDDRIGWIQLFEIFQPKLDKNLDVKFDNKTIWNKTQTTQQKNYTNRDRNRVKPANSNIKGNINYTRNDGGSSGSTTTMTSPERHKNTLSSNLQLQALQNNRQFCIYYGFLCLELFLKYNFIKYNVGNVQPFGKLLLTLSMYVKYKSTYTLTTSTMNHRGDKAIQEINKKMKVQHQTYQTIYNDITLQLQKQGLLRKIKEDISFIIGRNQIINQDRIQKYENQVIKISQENIQLLSQEIKMRGKSMKDFNLAQTLDFIVDVLSLGIGKNKALQQMKQSVKSQDDDLKDYVLKVITKTDRITNTQ